MVRHACMIAWKYIFIYFEKIVDTQVHYIRTEYFVITPSSCTMHLFRCFTRNTRDAYNWFVTSGNATNAITFVRESGINASNKCTYTHVAINRNVRETTSTSIGARLSSLQISYVSRQPADRGTSFKSVSSPLNRESQSLIGSLRVVFTSRSCLPHVWS